MTQPTRRIRAGSPPPGDLPINFAGREPEQPSELVVLAEWAAAVACVVAVFFLGWFFRGFLQ